MAANRHGRKDRRVRKDRPLIGITGYLEPARWADFVREAVISPVTYTRAVERSGGTPVILAPVPLTCVPRLVESLDGIVFTCGPDLDPRLYGAVAHEKTSEPDRRRDTFELGLMRAAIDGERPFLAICRGMQALNVVRSGTLIQHLPEVLGHDRHAPDPVKMAVHDVQLSAGSKLGQMLGGHAAVPTRHHQGIQQLGSGLLSVAWADDQLVEAVELQGHPFGLGVQWHPEEGDDLRVFSELVKAASGP